MNLLFLWLITQHSFFLFSILIFNSFFIILTYLFFSLNFFLSSLLFFRSPFFRGEKRFLSQCFSPIFSQHLRNSRTFFTWSTLNLSRQKDNNTSFDAVLVSDYAECTLPRKVHAICWYNITIYFHQ